MQILYGNLAPEGSVAKITGKEGLQFRGPARVFDSEEAMLDVVEEDPQQLKVLRRSLGCGTFALYEFDVTSRHVGAPHSVLAVGRRRHHLISGQTFESGGSSGQNVAGRTGVQPVGVQPTEGVLWEVAVGLMRMS